MNGYFLFNGYRFSEISRLVNVKPSERGGVIREQLKHGGARKQRKLIGKRRKRYQIVAGKLDAACDIICGYRENTSPT